MKKIYYVFALLLTAFGFSSCSNNLEDVEEAKGYIQLDMKTLVSTNTRADAPSGYEGKTLLVTIYDAQSKVVKQSTWKDGSFTDAEFASPIEVEPGTYTVEAHSANWDGSGSGLTLPTMPIPSP